MSTKDGWLRPHVLVVLGVIVALLVGAAWSSATNWTYAAPPDEGSPPIVAETPRATPTETPKPRATPTPTPTPEPAKPNCFVPWHFEGATFSIPALGIDKHPITEYTSANLVTEQVWSPEDQDYVEVPGTLVPGEDGTTIAWYSSIAQGKSILSACATNTAYIFGHSYGWGEAIFNDVPFLPVGAEVIIETPTERLTYTLQAAVGDGANGGTAEIAKVKLKQDSRYLDGVAGRLVVVTCYKGGAYVDGHSTTNALSTFQLTKAEYLVDPPVQTNPRVVDHLF